MFFEKYFLFIKFLWITNIPIFVNHLATPWNEAFRHSPINKKEQIWRLYY